MTSQPEQILEDNLIIQLQQLGYSNVSIKDEKDLLSNLKSQLEKHNQTTFTNKEFDKILNHLNKGNIFEKAKTLRDKFVLQRENTKQVPFYVEFIQQEFWCQNQFQVTRQVTMEGTYKNRYDVTILVNGFPLVQIELKRRGIELKEAFNQINRYQIHSYWTSSGLFQYIQLFVISNGVNTKYYANNRYLSFEQTFFWADKENNAITQLEAFTKEFLEPCHMSKIVTKYIVLHETQRILMVLRPYQYYAVESIVERVKTSHKNGYIWHTTGSGKTLTSFKASQILINIPKVHKVVFVVDRKDLDFQTQKEFDAFSKGSVDATDDTAMLVEQFVDNTKLILTTIQKLNNAIQNRRYLSRMETQKDERIIFIFDECHRSQFGETHKRITNFFTKAQLFGFTGTPIFVENAVKNEHGKRTTKELFEECLHKYVITDAIRDANVLKFAIEYVGRYKEKEGIKNEIDIEVEDIDREELMSSPQRIEKIINYIIANHNRKTYNRIFNSILCVSSIDSLITYYELFKAKKEEGKHDLKIATIFSYTANEESRVTEGMIAEEEFSMAAESQVPYGINTHSRDKLESFIGDYNQLFGTKFTTKDSQSFYNYYNDISKKVKDCEVDILLVVNMFLTGFDSKKLNTLYADKNLKFHGLIQAYSRTNRIYNEQKSQGNIVCFRNLKKNTDDAIALFANKEAKETIIIEPYERYVEKFNKSYKALLKIAPTVDSVNQLKDEEKELEFIKAFREIMRLRNILVSFADFEWSHLLMTEQEFEDYKSKYLDLYDKVKRNHQKEKVSILNEVDFELQLIHRDEINVSYILKLLAKYKNSPKKDKEKQKKQILDLLLGEARLRSKKELIEKFIEENIPQINDPDTIPDEFENFLKAEGKKEFQNICKSENLNPVKFEKIVSDYLFTERIPLRDDILESLEGNTPGVKDRKVIAERIIEKLKIYVDVFISGVNSNE